MNDYLFQKIKQIGWANRNAWLKENPRQKFISTYAINGVLEEPKDWHAMATKCGNNPNHEHFGKTAEEIQKIWSTKANTGADRGNTLDDYIKAVLSETRIDTSSFDEQLVNKCHQFDKLYTNVFAKFDSYIGSEIWLTSYNLGLSVRLDSLFKVSDDTLFISEWKSTEKMSMTNKWQKLLGPMNQFDASDLNKYTLQLHIYKYILLEYGLSFNIVGKIFNMKTDDYLILEGFEYDKHRIEDIVTFTRQSLL